MADEGTVTVEGLQAELNRQKEINQTLGGKVTHFEKTYKGIDPDEFHATKQALAELQQKASGGDPEKIKQLLEAAKADVRKEIQSELDTERNQVKTLSGRLKEITVVEGVFSKAAGKLYDKAHDDFKDYVRRYCDAGDDGQIIVKDDKGNQRYSPKNPSQPMSPEELIEELSNKKDHWFANTIPAGGKAGGEKYANGASKLSLQQFHALGSAEQQDYLRKNPDQVAALMGAMTGRAN